MGGGREEVKDRKEEKRKRRGSKKHARFGENSNKSWRRNAVESRCGDFANEDYVERLSGT